MVIYWSKFRRPVYGTATVKELTYEINYFSEFVSDPSSSLSSTHDKSTHSGVQMRLMRTFQFGKVSLEFE